MGIMGSGYQWIGSLISELVKEGNIELGKKWSLKFALEASDQIHCTFVSQLIFYPQIPANTFGMRWSVDNELV